jgi:hypothetical protein
MLNNYNISYLMQAIFQLFFTVILNKLIVFYGISRCYPIRLKGTYKVKLLRSMKPFSESRLNKIHFQHLQTIYPGKIVAGALGVEVNNPPPRVGRRDVAKQ